MKGIVAAILAVFAVTGLALWKRRSTDASPE